MPKLTQEELITKYLRTYPGFIPSYALEKVEICGQWVGTRGTRTARSMAEEGKIIREDGKSLMNKGVYTDGLGKRIEHQYVYYSAGRPKRVENFIIPETGEKFTKEIW